jgi:hypothetical protein
MPEYKIGEIICKSDCRFGLDQNFNQCTHVEQSKLRELALELANFEAEGLKESDLCQGVKIYIDDPEFWAQTLCFDQKLQRHSKFWLREAFVNCSKHQLLRLSGKELDSVHSQIFLKRIEQLLAMTQFGKIENLEEDIKYWISNIQRVNRVNSL